MSADAIRPMFRMVGGVRTYIEQAGAEGPPVVLVHTAGTQASEWRYSIPEIAAQRYTVYAVDLPEHGKTDPLPDGRVEDIHRYAEFVWNVIEELQLERPYVVGCSIGGCIVLDLAVHHGEHLRGAVALAATAHNRSVSPMLLELAREDAGSPSWADRAALAARHSTGPRAPKAHLAALERLHRASDPSVMASDLRAWNAHDLREHLGSARCPVKCLIGGEDFFIPERSKHDLQRILGPDRVEEVLEVGHYPMIDWPEFPGWLTRQLSGMAPTLLRS
ncbi:MAG: alpha/beta fold hydrolase [Hyphomicrobiaceae bacterium]